VQRGIVDVDIGTTGRPGRAGAGGWGPFGHDRVRGARAGREAHTVPAQNLAYDLPDTTLPGSDVVLTNESVPVR